MSLESIYPALPKTTRGYSYKLTCDPSRCTLVYTNGANIFLRNINNSQLCDIYSNHSCPVQVAKCSSSGKYVCSSDKRGNFHIWEFLIGGSHKLIKELQPPLLVINDVAWSEDSTKIAVGGQGRERFGHVFTSDSGNSVGEIMGITREVTCVGYRSCKPYRVVFGCEDGSVCYFNGPPFKFAKKIEAFRRCVNCLSYTLDGSLLACGGSDGRILILNGDNGNIQGEFGMPAHNRSVMGLSWSHDCKQLVSVGTDAALKVWSLEDFGKLISKHQFNNDDTQSALENQQLGCIWTQTAIISVSLSGHLSFFNSEDYNLNKVIKGHQNPITALCFTDGLLISGGQDGVICIWNNDEQSVINAHINQVKSIASANRWILSCGMDDNLVFFNPHQNAIISKVLLNDQPVGCVTTDQGITIVACRNSLVKFEGTALIAKHLMPFEVTCISISSDYCEFAIGGNDNKLITYSLGNLAEPIKCIPVMHGICVVSYSPDGQFLAVADDTHTILCFQRSDYQLIDKGYWTHHAANVTSLSWSPSSQYLLSSSVDSHLMIHNVKDITNVRQIRNAHPRSPVYTTCWPYDDIMYSAGFDCCIRKWKI